MKKLVVPAIALLSLLFSGCVGTDIPSEPDDDPGVSSLTYNIDAEPVASVIPRESGTPSFALGVNLLSRADGDNPVISPASAYLALSMAYNGSAGNTAEEFKSLLGGDTEYVNGLAAVLTEHLSQQEKFGSTFSVCNSAWVDDRADIREDFLKTLVSHFNADVFSAQLGSEDTLNAINNWVSDKTVGLIPQLFEDPLSDDAMMVLINTLYMKSLWQTPFSMESTHPGVFNGAEDVKTVDYMHNTAYFNYASGDGWSGVVLPYMGSDVRFAAILPDDGTSPRELLGSISEEDFSDLLSSGTRRVALTIPKFTIDYFMSMTDALKDLGLVSAFDPDTADLSLTGTTSDGYPLYISEVLQKVKIIVDEKGTEAAAATAEITFGCTSLPEDPVKLTFSRPFIYAIIDTECGMPLFMGILDMPQ